MGVMEWIRLGCAVIGGAVLLRTEWELWLERSARAKLSWRVDGAHDEVVRK